MTIAKPDLITDTQRFNQARYKHWGKDYVRFSDLDALGFNLVGFGCTTCIGNSGPLPVEISEAVNDNELVVAAVLSGTNGWASAWAMDGSGHFLFPCIPGGEPQRERAFRFGVNIVMYALTGNYKSDQLHAQALLERMGK